MSSSILDSLKAGHELSAHQVKELGSFLLDTSQEDAVKIMLLKSLSAKGETANEITEFVSYFLSQSKPVDLSDSLTGVASLDVCGTGGDNLDLFNVSTTSMFVMAAGGAKIVKHGNRGVTSLSGSSDVLSQLGIPLTVSEDILKRCLDEANVCFLYAPAYHPAFKTVAPLRKTLAKEGIQTIFNLIGPLLNPAKPSYQMVGVAKPERTQDFATILRNLGREQTYAVTGYTQDNACVDECSTMGLTEIHSSKPGDSETSHYSLDPRQLGLSLTNLSELKGSTPAKNAQTLVNILNGTETQAKRDIVILNSAVGLTCCKITNSFSQGVALASELLNSGKALQKLTSLQNIFS